MGTDGQPGDAWEVDIVLARLGEVDDETIGNENGTFEITGFDEDEVEITGIGNAERNGKTLKL